MERQQHWREKKWETDESEDHGVIAVAVRRIAVLRGVVQPLPRRAGRGRIRAMRRGITFGTFDVFHYGHLRILERTRELCDYMVVGVSSDELNLSKKGRAPFYPFEERARIIGALKCVDEVFKEEALEFKADYIRQYHADVLVMGDDWTGKFDWVIPLTGCQVLYLPRTPAISTTAIIEKIRS